MYEILGESVKSLLGGEVMQLFPGTTWYKEQITKPVYPHFYVHQLTLEAAEDRKRFWFLNYLMTIRYRLQAEPQNNPQLQEKLDEVGLALLAGIYDMAWGDLILHIRNGRYEKVQGVLHYFCNFTLRVTKEALDRGPLQESLVIGSGNEPAAGDDIPVVPPIADVPGGIANIPGFPGKQTIPDPPINEIEHPGFAFQLGCLRRRS